MTGLELELAKETLQYVLNQPAKGPKAVAKENREKASQEFAQVDNFADATRLVLKCYHPTATYRSADVIQQPWERQTQYGAAHSALIRIDYSGWSSTRYHMNVAVMTRTNQLRAQLVSDSATVPARGKCELSNWLNISPKK